MPVKVIGADRVAEEFNRLSGSVYATQEAVLALTSDKTLSLLKQNTPRDTGALSRSWYEKTRTRTKIKIGVTPDQDDKLVYIVFGTRYIQPNDFISPVLIFIGENIENIMRSNLKASHPYLTNIQSRGGIRTPSNIVGNTKTTFNKRRGRGFSVAKRPSSGRKRYNRKIGLRRTV